MASRTVEFIYQLIDGFTKPAGSIEKAALGAQKTIHAMGAAANSADSSIGRLGKHMSELAAAQRAADPAWANADKRLRSYGQSAQVAANNSRSLLETHKQIQKFEKENEIKNKYAPGGVGKMHGYIRQGADLYFSGMMLEQGLQLVDSTIRGRADVDTMKRKLSAAFGGGAVGDAIGKQSYEAAFKMSGKYRNTSVEENMKIIDDLRANLPESMDKILGENLEPFIKLHSFLKAWGGGKHAGAADAMLKDIGAAIRSGDLTGGVTAKLLAEHGEALRVATINMGDKFKVVPYFQAVQKAATALSVADKTFKYVDFPVLVSRLGRDGAVAIATGFQKLMGTRLTQPTMEAWRNLGLVDMGQVRLDKNGFIDPKSVVGKKWLKNSDDYALNTTDALMKYVLPAIGKQQNNPIFGEMSNAYLSGDVEKLAHVMEVFRQSPKAMIAMARQLTAMGYDRNFVKEMEELILGSASILRDRERAKAIAKNQEDFKNYDEALQEVQAQANRTWLAMTGDEFMPWINNNLRRLGGVLKYVGDAYFNSSFLQKATSGAGLAAQGYLAIRGAQMLAHAAGMQRVATILSKIGIIKIGIAVVGFEMAQWIYNNWSRIQELAAKPTNFSVIFPEAPEWMKWMMSGNATTPKGPVESLFGIPGGVPGMIDRWVNPPKPGEAPNIPQSQGQAEVRVQTQTQVDIPSVKLEGKVTVSGQVNAPLQGSGTVSGATQAASGQSRGESAVYRGENQ